MAEREPNLNEKLLKYLLDRGMLSAAQADALRKEHHKTGKSIRELISDQALVEEEALLTALAAVSKLPTIRLYELQIPMDVRQLVRADVMRNHLVLPFGYDPEDPHTVLVAMHDPMNL